MTPGVRSLDHGAAADEHGHVLAAARAVEEKVPGLKVADRDGRGSGHLATRVVRKAHTDLTPGPGGQPRAVEADAGRLTGPDVGHAQLAFGRLDRSPHHRARSGD